MPTPAKRNKNKKKASILFKKTVVFFAITLTIVILAYNFIRDYTEPSSFNKSKFTIHGVDLSHHNPIIDWTKTRDKNDISFVYLKATGGVTHTDRNYPHNYQSAKTGNVKVGSYHFYLFCVSGKKQARHFINTIQYESGDLYPAIDVEHSKDNPTSTDIAFVDNTIKELTILENELYEYFGVHPIIYTNKECYKKYVKDNFPHNLIWMCNLHKEPSDVENWIIWQFSHTGELDGVTGDIDLNYYRYPHEELNKIMLP